MFVELLKESYYQYVKFAAKVFEYKYMSYAVALLRAMFIYLFICLSLSFFEGPSYN